MIIFPLLTLVVYGPGKFGKSSFIKRLNEVISLSDTRSVHSTPNIYEFNVTWPEDSNPNHLSVLDLPGLEYTELSMSSAFIEESLGIFMAKKNDRKIDVFLLFNSLCHSSEFIPKTMRELTEALGNMPQSVVFILSKADLCSQSSEQKQAVIDECMKLGVNYVEWTDKADYLNMKKQLLHLKTAIEGSKPFFLSRDAEKDKLVEEAANYRRTNDPSRYKTVVETLTLPKITKEETETYKVTETVPKYTDKQQIEKLARTMQQNGPKDFPRSSIVFVPKQVTRRIPNDQENFKENDFGQGIKWIEINEVKEVPETKITYEERPLENYKAILESETETIETMMTRKVKIMRICEERKEYMAERYPFKWYLDIVRSEMLREVWENLRTLSRQKANSG